MNSTCSINLLIRLCSVSIRVCTFGFQTLVSFLEFSKWSVKSSLNRAFLVTDAKFKSGYANGFSVDSLESSPVCKVCSFPEKAVRWSPSMFKVGWSGESPGDVGCFTINVARFYLVWIGETYKLLLYKSILKEGFCFFLPELACCYTWATSSFMISAAALTIDVKWSLASDLCC